jgi:hypothetical protein
MANAVLGGVKLAGVCAGGNKLLLLDMAWPMYYLTNHQQSCVYGACVFYSTHAAYTAACNTCLRCGQQLAQGVRASLSACLAIVHSMLHVAEISPACVHCEGAACVQARFWHTFLGFTL